jgi:hypothetical protein
MRKSKAARVSSTEKLSQPGRKKRPARNRQSEEVKRTAAKSASTAGATRPRANAAAVNPRALEAEQVKNFYLGEQAVAKRWGVSVKYVQSLRYDGGGPVFTAFGRNVRYHIRELKAFEKANSFTSRADMAAAGVRANK